ncbi:MAG: hypothetical protein HYR63_21450 [Proteobacteria bacterium]|nr:hypothetical protein [Pseudomonadota bacterium]MBI3500121.1 hypothetical protein [Pseudomonadota bacterium]
MRRFAVVIRRRFAEGVRRYFDALGQAIRPSGRQLSGRTASRAKKRARGVKEADLALSEEILETLRSKLKDGPSARPGG